MKRYAFFSAALLIAFSASAQVVGGGPVIGGGGSGGTGTIGGSTGATDDALLCADGTGGATLGVCTVGNLDNLRLDGNTISSTDTNGDISVTPNGTGGVAIGKASTTAMFEVYSGSAQDSFGVSAGAFVFGTNAAQSGAHTYQLLNSGIIRTNSAGKLIFWSAANLETGAADTALVRSAAGVLGVTDGSTGGGAFNFKPLASPPRTCDATAEGDVYADTSHALCFCDGTSWNVLTGSGAGSCV